MRPNSSLPARNTSGKPLVRGTSRARESVSFDGRAERGTIIIKTNERRLYFVLGDGKALRYKVSVGKPSKQWAVGKPSKQWAGATRVSDPAWTPPAEVRADRTCRA
jgi:lipoprotein-anchoring transpeptidase ErfK/SrfK